VAVYNLWITRPGVTTCRRRRPGLKRDPHPPLFTKACFEKSKGKSVSDNDTKKRYKKFLEKIKHYVFFSS